MRRPRFGSFDEAVMGFVARANNTHVPMHQVRPVLTAIGMTETKFLDLRRRADRLAPRGKKARAEIMQIYGRVLAPDGHSEP